MTEASTQAHPASSVPARCLYLYGIVDGMIPPGLLAGAARGAPLEMTEAGRIAAVHTELDTAEFAAIEPDVREGSPLAELARRHDEVVTALALAGPVLPARFGTLLADRAVLSRLLEDGQVGLAQALDRVRGHAEWRLTIECESSDDSGAESAEATSGSAYLLARRDERARTVQRRSQLRTAMESLDNILASFADETTHLRLGGSGASARRAYLVPESSQQSFLTAADEVAAELSRAGCTVRLVGPLPAYSFADIELGSPAP
jgi:hypothetical protein